MKKYNRREFFVEAGKKLAGLAGMLSILSDVKDAFGQEYPDLVAIKGADIKQAVNKGLELLGGIRRFIKPGDIVVVKPNIGWNRQAKYAANTNPEVVKCIVDLCFQAGASKVKVFDRSCASQRISYQLSGIAEAAESAGADVKYRDGIDSDNFVSVKIEKGIALKSSLVIKDILECDKLINIPVAKHHSSATLTLGMKNWMGVTGDNRSMWHLSLHQSIADFATIIKPAFTLIDATKILVAHGPTGGNLSDVRNTDTIIISTDSVAADSYATGLFGLKPESVNYIKLAYKHSIGEMNLNKLLIKTKTL